MSILTSSSQYLQPEYLSPSTPNQLDAKNSPLALLAATCNSIGKDSPNSKSLIPPLEKDRKRKEENKTNSGRNSSSSSVASFRSISPNLDTNKHVKANNPSPRKDTADLKEIPVTPPRINTDDSLKLVKDYARSCSVSPRDKKSENGRLGSPNESNKTSSISSGLSLSTATTTVSSSSYSNGYPTSPPKFRLPDYPAVHLPLSGYNTVAGFPYSHLGGSGAAAALLAAHKHSAESMKYTTVRTASGATTLVPTCSDPYCTHCKLTIQTAQLSPAAAQCSSGCVQCAHDKAMGLPPNYHHLASAALLGVPGLGGALSGLSPPAGGSLFPHVPPAGGNGTQAHVCSWISSSGSGVCGKRFNSSEELMQHLRSHTSSLESPALHSGLPSYHGLPSASLSPSLLRQAYGGRISPGLLNASRYHPYLKSLSSLPGSEAALSSVHPTLGAYSSLYALYGNKLGVP